ncbi:MAG: TIGR03086 family metal-binding protein [Streptosporangiaceae bacterium]
MTDIRELDARAVRASVAVVAAVTTADLTRPTPCSGWTLGDLLTHMTAQHNGLAAAAAGQGGDLAAWRVARPGIDPAGDYAAAADRVIAAFGEPGVLGRTFTLPEIAPGLAFPAAQAIGFHFIDYVVHGWDVAQSLGLDYALEPDLLGAALPVAETVPDGEFRLGPGAAFAPRLDPRPDSGADPMGRVLALLGRSESPAMSTES